MRGTIQEGLESGRYVTTDFFVYQAFFDTVAQAGGVANASISIQADSDFYWSKGTFFFDDGTTTQDDSTRILPLFTVLLTDTGAGRQLMDQAVPVENMFGTGQIPFILPAPRLFQARSTLQIQVVNLDPNADYSLYLSFIGQKAFLRGV